MFVTQYISMRFQFLEQFLSANIAFMIFHISLSELSQDCSSVNVGEFPLILFVLYCGHIMFTASTASHVHFLLICIPAIRAFPSEFSIVILHDLNFSIISANMTEI